MTRPDTREETPMAGHSHWANIQHKKGIADAKRGKVWSKLSRLIIVAARHGGGDPEMNLKLRYAIDKAREVSMPKDNIERAIKRGTGEVEGQHFEELTYEGIGPGGVAVDAGADDLKRAGDTFEITCDPTAFAHVKEALEKNHVAPKESDISQV